MIKNTYISMWIAIGIVVGLMLSPILQLWRNSVASNDQQPSQETIHDSTASAEQSPNAENADKSVAKPKRKNAPELTAAQRLSAFLATNTDFEARGKFLRELIYELCEAGKTEEAYSLIDPNFGQMRDEAHFAFFHKAKLSNKELIDLMKKEQGWDLNPIINGFFMRFDKDQMQKIIDSEEINHLSAFFKKYGQHQSQWAGAIATSLSQQVKGAPKQKMLETYRFITELAMKGNLTLWNAYYEISRNKELAPFESWELVKQLPTEHKNDSYYTKQSNEIRRFQIDSMADSNF